MSLSRTAAVKVKKAEEPPIKPMSPYSLFVQDQYKDGAPTGNFAERSSEISARWKQLGDAEKQVCMSSRCVRAGSHQIVCVIGVHRASGVSQGAIREGSGGVVREDRPAYPARHQRAAQGSKQARYTPTCSSSS